MTEETKQEEVPPQEIITPQVFSYKKPGKSDQGKKEIVMLCKSPTMRGSVHIIREGGGEHLHSHKSVDGFWMVVSGRVAFYGDEDTFYGEFGPMEGIMMPRNNRYWFECTSIGDAEIIQVLHFDTNRGFEREDHEEPKFDRREIKIHFGGKRFPRK